MAMHASLLSAIGPWGTGHNDVLLVLGEPRDGRTGETG